MGENLRSPDAPEQLTEHLDSASSAEQIAESLLTERFAILPDDPRKQDFIDTLEDDVEEASRFLYGAGNKLESLSDFERDEVSLLSEELFLINGMDWKQTKEGEHYKARRADGSEVYVPANYFPDDSHRLDLKNVHVNTKDGFTIHDALRRIIGSESFLRKDNDKPEQES